MSARRFIARCVARNGEQPLDRLAVGHEGSLGLKDGQADSDATTRR